MERKTSILLYSNQSPTCARLMESIHPSFFSAAGLNMLCIDTKRVRDRVHAMRITRVPSVLVTYYDKEGVVYQGLDEIQMWMETLISEMRACSGGSTSGAAAMDIATAADEDEDENDLTMPPPVASSSSSSDDIPSGAIKKTGKKDVMTMAMEMQKSRDSKMPDR